MTEAKRIGPRQRLHFEGDGTGFDMNTLGSALAGVLNYRQVEQAARQGAKRIRGQTEQSGINWVIDLNDALGDLGK